MRTVTQPTGVWERYLMALDDVTDRLQRITRALEEASVPYALVGGQAVGTVDRLIVLIIRVWIVAPGGIPPAVIPAPPARIEKNDGSAVVPPPIVMVVMMLMMMEDADLWEEYVRVWQQRAVVWRRRHPYQMLAEPPPFPDEEV